MIFVRNNMQTFETLHQLYTYEMENDRTKPPKRESTVEFAEIMNQSWEGDNDVVY